MAKTKVKKEQSLKSVADLLSASKAAVFANFQGLKMKEIDELRSACKKQGIGCAANKKTLLGLALKQLGHNVDVKSFEGGVAVFTSAEDEVSPAQTVANFAKTHQAAKVFGGILNGEYVSAEKVLELSKLPSKKELLARFVGAINAPKSGFVNVLAGNLRSFINVLNALKEKQA